MMFPNDLLIEKHDSMRSGIDTVGFIDASASQIGPRVTVHRVTG